MTQPFIVLTSPRFERLFRSLVKRHREHNSLRDTVFGILSTDPYRERGRQSIRKLSGVYTAPDSIACGSVAGSAYAAGKQTVHFRFYTVD